MPKKVGESIRQLPVDPKQEVSTTELAVLRDMFHTVKPSAPSSKSNSKLKSKK